MNRYIALLFFIVVTALAAYFASRFMPGTWYAELAKPDWTPPNWVFAPAWTILYIMIALAGWLAWRYQGLGLALLFWFVQLGLNANWSYLMFGQHDITAAYIDIAFLWLSIVAFILAVRKISWTAVFLFIPYLLWVSYAGALNAAIWQMNPAG